MTAKLRLTATATGLHYELAPHFQTETEGEQFDAIGNRIAKLSLSRQEWAAIRRHNAPPLEWLDNDDDYASL